MTSRQRRHATRLNAGQFSIDELGYTAALYGELWYTAYDLLFWAVVSAPPADLIDWYVANRRNASLTLSVGNLLLRHVDFGIVKGNALQLSKSGSPSDLELSVESFAIYDAGSLVDLGDYS